MHGTDRWFLTEGERNNSATRLDAIHADGRAWTEGNSVTPLVHGRTYFTRLANALRTLGSGDRVYLFDWRSDADERMDGPGSEIGTLLADAASRGADVRGLVWRSHPDEENFSEQENAKLSERVNRSGGEILLDERVRWFGSHHQKMVLIRRQDPTEDVAFVGGIDLCHGRNDDERHLGDPQPISLDARYGPTPAWHDVQMELRGPVVGDLVHTFRERWEDPTRLDHMGAIRGLLHRSVRAPRRAKPLPPEAEAPPPAGDVAVQVLRTYPSRRPPYPFAPRGERSVARAYSKAFARARSFIYVEDQYLWSREVANGLARALRRSPGLRLIAVVPRHPDRDGRISGPIQRVGQIEAVELVKRAGGDRVAIYDLESEAGRPIYVHAKVCIVDDVWMTIGSDNLNLRSWTHDSELSCALLDPRVDPREPTDPSGTGDRARALPRELRLQLWREHLGQGPTDEELLDPDRGFEVWRRTADALDAWHRRGRGDPRPAGRARRHRPEPLPMWARPWARTLNRFGADPDGRPRDVRRAGRF